MNKLKYAGLIIAGILVNVASTIVCSWFFQLFFTQLKDFAIFGLLAVLAVGLGPFLQIAVQYLALRVTAALSGFLAMQEHTKLLSCAADAMGYMLAMTGSAMLMVVVAVCAFLKAVNG